MLFLCVFNVLKLKYFELDHHAINNKLFYIFYENTFMIYFPSSPIY